MLETEYFESNGQKMAYVRLGEGDTVFIWAHGWGLSHQSLLPLSKTLQGLGTHYTLDFPAFGASPRPDRNWDASDYAEFLKAFIQNINPKKLVWVCHSFGARIGLRIAAETELIDRIVVIGGHGVPMKRPLWKRLKMFLSVRIFKLMKLFFVRNRKTVRAATLSFR